MIATGIDKIELGLADKLFHIFSGINTNNGRIEVTIKDFSQRFSVIIA